MHIRDSGYKYAPQNPKMMSMRSLAIGMRPFARSLFLHSSHFESEAGTYLRLISLALSKGSKNFSLLSLRLAPIMGAGLRLDGGTRRRRWLRFFIDWGRV